MAEDENEYEQILLWFSLSIAKHDAARETFKQIRVNTGVHMLNFLNYSILDQTSFCDPSTVCNNKATISMHIGKNKLFV